MKDFHPHDGTAFPIRNIGVFPRLIFKYLSMSFHYKGFKRCSHLYFNLSLLIRSHTTLTTRHFLFRQSTILKFGCTDRIWTCITLINSQVDCQVSHGTIWNLVGLLRLERRVFWLRVRCITNFATNPWNIWSLLLPLETSKEAVWFNLRRKGYKGFFEFSISSLLYEKGTLYSARTLLSFTCFPFVEGEPVYKGNFL